MTDNNLRGHKFLPYKQGVAGSNQHRPLPLLIIPCFAGIYVFVRTTLEKQLLSAMARFVVSLTMH